MPSVTVVVPCYNEAGHIIRCLDSIVGNGLPEDRLEILVVDGASSDGTSVLVADYARRHPSVRLIGNPRRLIPAALNLGIAAARFEFVLRMDAHSTLEPGYIERCLECLDQGVAERIGGCLETRPQEETLLGRAIALALSSPFGVGNSVFRTASGTKTPLLVDTVPFWCCHRSLFEKAGLFDERLSASEDVEFSLRLKRLGLRTALAPGARGTYFARSGLAAFWKHNIRNGIWAVLPFRYVDGMPVRPRHLIPLLFVSSLVAACVLSASGASNWPLLLVAGSYLACSLFISLATACRKRQFGMLFWMPVAFGALHVGYGAGSLMGVGQLILGSARKERS